MAQRNKLFAEVLKSKGLDLSKDYFTLSSYEVSIVEETRKAFRFSGVNYMGRSKVRQFWYAAQRGNK